MALKNLEQQMVWYELSSHCFITIEPNQQITILTFIHGEEARQYEKDFQLNWGWTTTLMWLNMHSEYNENMNMKNAYEWLKNNRVWRGKKFRRGNFYFKGENGKI